MSGVDIPHLRRVLAGKSLSIQTTLEILAELEASRAALAKIDAIRNNIIGKQGVDWSRDIYPLVAVLGEVGYEGEGYDRARARIIAEMDAEANNPHPEAEKVVDKAFAAIAHGDEIHRGWLRHEMQKFVPTVRAHLAELEAARAVVEAARRLDRADYSHQVTEVRVALEAYDALVSK